MTMKIPYLHENYRYTTRKDDRVFGYIAFKEFLFYSIQQCEIQNYFFQKNPHKVFSYFFLDCINT